MLPLRGQAAVFPQRDRVLWKHPTKWKLSISPLRQDLVHYILLAIPDTLFFLPAFPFSDYCLKRGKAQFVEYQPEES